jgi:KipI family sensor histidine kinase inhibitor
MKWCYYGETAIYVDLDIEGAPDRAARTHALRLRLDGRAAEVIVGAGTIVLTGIPPGAAAQIDAALAALPARGSPEPRGAVRRHEIQVVYDGPDLEEVAAAAGASTEEVIAWHTAREVIVELLGFLPGFAYLGDIHPRLVRPRRASPRPSVPAGSVGIAGAFTGIYPFASPGGWSLLGRAAGVSLFDPDRDPPALFRPGDRVRFLRASAGEMPVMRSEEQHESARAIEILSITPGATVQDGGRIGQLSNGLPPSGPLDVETHAAANLAAGNAEGAAAIEIPLGGLTARAIGELTVSIDGAPAQRLRDGGEIEVPPGPAAVRYLAILGGIAVPLRLGARATLLAARLGGLFGRPLRRGDRVPVGDEPEGGPGAREREVPIRGESIAVDPGPHIDRFPAGAMDALLATPWRISRWSDRVGVRLSGGRVPRVVR